VQLFTLANEMPRKKKQDEKNKYREDTNHKRNIR